MLGGQADSSVVARQAESQSTCLVKVSWQSKMTPEVLLLGGSGHGWACRQRSHRELTGREGARTGDGGRWSWPGFWRAQTLCSTGHPTVLHTVTRKRVDISYTLCACTASHV